MAFQRKKPAAIGTEAPFPGFVEPALASLIEKVPRGQRWIHEIERLATAGARQSSRPKMRAPANVAALHGLVGSPG